MGEKIRIGSWLGGRKEYGAHNIREGNNRRDEIRGKIKYVTGIAIDVLTMKYLRKRIEDGKNELSLRSDVQWSVGNR